MQTQYFSDTICFGLTKKKLYKANANLVFQHYNFWLAETKFQMNRINFRLYRDIKPQWFPIETAQHMFH